MASLGYLWQNRIVFSVLDIKFYRAWLKRFFTFYELIRRNKNRIKLKRKGATISVTAEVGAIKADGNMDKLHIGEFTFIGKVEIALHDKVIIGNRVCINDGVIILTASHDLNDPHWQHKKSPIIIEDYAWICTNSIILPGVTIGKGAVVGAGAVVRENVLPFGIVVGNPATAIERKRISSLVYNPCEFLAANNAWLKG